MKTISGICVSSKQTSLSKAAKILSKFVSAENGASKVINTYLHMASCAFNELNQLHKELQSSHSHLKKHKKNRAEEDCDGDGGRVVDSSVRSFEIIHGMKYHDEDVQSKKKNLKRKKFGMDGGDEKSAQIGVEFSQELDGSIGDHKKHKKHKR